MVDVGNSSVKWRLSTPEEYQPLKGGVLSFERLEELRKYSNVPYKVVASVKPSVNPRLEEILINPYFVSVEDCKPLIGIDYETPQTLGVDRVLNAIGGLEYAETFAVVSFGTATVVDLVLEKNFQGGAIFLGLEKHLGCLSNNAEQLPLVDLKTKPALLGKSTNQCIQSGVFYSQIFTVRGFLENFGTTYGVEKVFLTGGLGGIFKDFVPQAIFDKELLFRGLFRIFRFRFLGGY